MDTATKTGIDAVRTVSKKITSAGKSKEDK